VRWRRASTHSEDQAHPEPDGRAVPPPTSLAERCGKHDRIRGKFS
jgi:hypothetical protein